MQSVASLEPMESVTTSGVALHNPALRIIGLMQCSA